jgi:hypothetical protein
MFVASNHFYIVYIVLPSGRTSKKELTSRDLVDTDFCDTDRQSVTLEKKACR